MSDVHTERLNGQPVVRLALPNGDSALVALHGAQVLSWKTAGGERLFLSPRAKWDGQSAIRGGTPICWPQFNQRGPLAKHGFARNLTWHAERVESTADGVLATFSLHDSEQTRAWWPHGFIAQLLVHLSPNQLRMTLQLRNTGAEAWSFTGALHTYLQVPHIAAVQLHGLDGVARWDAVRDVHDQQVGAVRFDGEYDSVFAPPKRALTLRSEDAGFALAIEHSETWGNAVVWNPGAALCATLADMPADGFEHMLCVEAACVDTAVALQPGQSWTGWQQLRDMS